MTANNPLLRPDLANRCVRIRLEPSAADPSLRTGWIHPRIEAFTRDNRARILGALVYILEHADRVRKNPSCKAPTTRTFGNYGPWSEIVGTALVLAGFTGFLANLEEAKRKADPQGESDKLFAANVLDYIRAGIKPDAQGLYRLPAKEACGALVATPYYAVKVDRRDGDGNFDNKAAQAAWSILRAMEGRRFELVEEGGARSILAVKGTINGKGGKTLGLFSLETVEG